MWFREENIQIHRFDPEAEEVDSILEAQKKSSVDKLVERYAPLLEQLSQE